MQFLLLPTILTAMIGYLTHDNFSKQISSYEYNSIGVMIFMYSGIGVISAFNFIEKDIKQGNIRLIFTPVRTIWIHLSHMISGMLFGTITIAINMMIFKVLFNVNYNDNAVIIFLSFCAIAYISSAIGIFLSIIIDETLKIKRYLR
jgi:ABC-type multidrug transport system permease subunit